jgi:hypothetical protein
MGDRNGGGDICDSSEYYLGDHVGGDTTGPCYTIKGNDVFSKFGNYTWRRGNSSGKMIKAI